VDERSACGEQAAPHGNMLADDQRASGFALLRNGGRAAGLHGQ